MLVITDTALPHQKGLATTNCGLPGSLMEILPLGQDLAAGPQVGSPFEPLQVTPSHTVIGIFLLDQPLSSV